MNELIQLLVEGARLAKAAGEAETEAKFQAAVAKLRKSAPDLASEYAAAIAKHAAERSDADESPDLSGLARRESQPSRERRLLWVADEPTPDTEPGGK